jgi:hypothetical protein
MGLYDVIDAKIAEMHSRIAEARQEIARLEDAIAQDFACIHELHVERNALHPLCTLPPEILLLILEILARDRWGEHWPVYDRRSSRTSEHAFGVRTGWPIVTGVCRRIRSLAIESPSLWSFIDFWPKIEWIDLCRRRAGNSPLVIGYNGKMTPRGSFQESLIATIARAERLELLMSGWSPMLLRAVIQALDSENENLRSLYYHSQLSEPMFELSHTSMRLSQSNLKSLTLINAHLRLGDLQLPSLTHLVFSKCEVKDGIGSLLQFIENAPQLRLLRLTRIAWSEHTGRVQPVHLSQLETLYLENVPVVLATLLPAFEQLRQQHHILMLPEPEEEVGSLSLAESRDASYENAIRIFGLHPDQLPAAQLSMETVPRTAEEEPFEVLALSLHIPHHEGSRTYTVRCRSVLEFGRVLSEVKTIHLSGKAVEHVFSPAVDVGMAALACVEHIIIENGEGDRVGLYRWLYHRYAAGKPIRVLDFRGCADLTQTWGSIAQIKEEIAPANVGEVLEDGRAV